MARVATPAANTKAMMSALNMGGRGMSATVPTMATAMFAVTAAMASTSISRRHHCQESCHHKRSKR
jgi:uncharacterized protein YggE